MTLIVEFVGGLFPPVLVPIQEAFSYEMNLLGAPTASLTAVVEEVSVLVSGQTEPCRGYPFVCSV